MQGITAAQASCKPESKFKRFQSFKKIFVIVLTFFSLYAVCTPSASAMDYLVGLKSGYFVWDPYLKRAGNPMFESMENGTGVLYGPVLGVLFTPDFSFSISGLFGKQSADWISEDYTFDEWPDQYYTGSFTVEIDRIDIDSALSYRIFENFKVFAGYKYQNNEFTQETLRFERDFSGSGEISGSYEKVEVSMPFHGPAAGIGVSMPIADNFFIAANLSAIYMWGDFDYKGTGYRYDGSTPAVKEPNDDSEVSGLTLRNRGINFEPTIGASMGEGLPIFTLGIRAQWSQVKFVDAPSYMNLDKSWNNDYQYGLFAAIVQPF